MAAASPVPDYDDNIVVYVDSPNNFADEVLLRHRLFSASTGDCSVDAFAYESGVAVGLVFGGEGLSVYGVGPFPDQEEHLDQRSLWNSAFLRAFQECVSEVPACVVAKDVDKFLVLAALWLWIARRRDGRALLHQTCKLPPFAPPR